jgi:hypothetical protein
VLNLLFKELLAEIEKIPVADIHTHLRMARPQAKNVAEVVLYGHIARQLISAGADPERLQNKDNPLECAEYALEFFPAIYNTANSWCLSRMMKDLYDIDTDVLDKSALERLAEAVEEKKDDSDRALDIFIKAGIEKVCTQTENKTDEELPHSNMFSFTYENPYFASYHYPRDYTFPLKASEDLLGRPMRTATDLYDAVDKHIDAVSWDEIRAYAAWIPSECVPRPASDNDVEMIIRSYQKEGEIFRGDYETICSAIIMWILDRLNEEEKPFQLMLGAEMVYGCSVMAPLGTAWREWLNVFFGYPYVHFNVLLAPVQEAALLANYARSISNVSVAGFWWHSLYPGAMQAGFAERLENVPANKIIGFFSDAWCAEWAYGKLALCRLQLARYLAAKIEEGFYTEARAMDLARQILWDTPRDIYRI